MKRLTPFVEHFLIKNEPVNSKLKKINQQRTPYGRSGLNNNNFSENNNNG